MTPDEILAEALERTTPADRQAFLDEACGPDLELREKMKRLVRAHEEEGNLLDRPPFEPPPDGGAGGVAGESVGPYRLLQRIGEGGMGEVWLAEQTEPVRRRVAVKVIKGGLASRQVLARFEAERQAIALMDHPNIAKVLDAGATAAGRPYFVMELVKGVSITKFCDERRMSVRERVELFVPVCQAIQHAHQKGVIHRDLKPSNVLVCLYDGRPVPKVIDFGVAKAVGTPLTNRTLFTEFGQVLGTLEYMSPEQAQLNQLDVDTRSDVYALGVLVYEILTGTPPLDPRRMRETSFGEALRVLREEDPPKPSVRSSSADLPAGVEERRSVAPRRLSGLLRGDLDWIVMKCLEKDRERRYATASALADDLERHLRQQPVEACPPSAWYRLRRAGSRHRIAFAGGALVLLFLVLLGGGLGWVLSDRAARDAAAEGEAGRALDEAAHHQSRGLYSEALSAARRAEGVLGPDLGATALRDRAARRRADLELVIALDAVRDDIATRTDAEGFLDSAGADPAFARAFREHGIDVEGLSGEEAAARLRGGTVATEVGAALDYWAMCSRVARGLMDPLWRKLLRIGDTLDRDPAHHRFRELMWKRFDAEALLAFAHSDEGLRLPATTQNLIAGQLFLGSPGRPEVVEFLRNAVRLYPDDFFLNSDLATALHSLDPPQTNEEIVYATAAVALRPRSPGAHGALMYALAAAGRFEEALHEGRRAHALDPTPGRTYSLGVCLQRAGRHDEALELIDRYIAIAPDDPDGYGARGVSLMAKGAVAEAVQTARDELRLGTKRPAIAYYRIGRGLGQIGDLEGSVAAYRESIRLDPDYPEAHCNLGLQLEAQGALAEAVSELRRGHELGSQRADWTYPSAEWLRRCETAAALDAAGSEVVSGARPATPKERLWWAMWSHKKARYFDAARLWVAAFADQPSLTDDLDRSLRYDAACAAALVGIGAGVGDPPSDAAERERWTRQSLAWLEADLAARVRRFDGEGEGPEVAARRAKELAALEAWRGDADLRGLRDPQHVGALDEDLRRRAERFWADSGALVARLHAAQPPAPPAGAPPAAR